MTPRPHPCLFLESALGDALGLPVETFDRSRIQREHGTYHELRFDAGHKWFDGVPPGTWTDDTQLTLAIARAHHRHRQARHWTPSPPATSRRSHQTRRAGYTTRDSVANLAKAFLEGVGDRGRPDGVCMKIAVGAYLAGCGSGLF